jgi:hypothetical protein
VDLVDKGAQKTVAGQGGYGGVGQVAGDHPQRRKLFR